MGLTGLEAGALIIPMAARRNWYMFVFYMLLLLVLGMDGGGYSNVTSRIHEFRDGQITTGMWDVTVSYEDSNTTLSDDITAWDTASVPPNKTERVLCGGALKSLNQRHAHLKLVCLPIIVTFGITGNILSFVVMGTNVYRLKSYSYYLRALAVFDSLTIITTAIIMGNDISRHLGTGAFLHKHNVLTCKLTNFLSSVVFLMSSWLIVAFTIDRYIAVCHPLHQYRLCTAIRAKAVIVLLLVLAMLSQTFRFYYIENLKRDRPCHVRRELRLQYFGIHYVWFSFTLRFALPFIVIVICNGLIIFHVQRMQRIRQTEVPIKKKRTHGAITTLVAVCTVFVVSLVPNAVLSLVLFVQGRDQATYCVLIRIDTPLQMIRLLNYSINFILYGLTGRLFRFELKRLLTCRRQAASSSVSNKVYFHHSMQRPLAELGGIPNAPFRRLAGGRHPEKTPTLGRHGGDYDESEV